MSNAFQFEELDGHIGLLTFDLKDQAVNTFSQHVLKELSEHVEQLKDRTDLKGLLIQSGKEGQFIAGADLNELGAFAYASPEAVRAGMEIGHDLFNRISKLPFPTVALVAGNCMGGGTELILSMDYRLAGLHPKAQIALPEVKVGIIPGWGGTQRMPRVVGVNFAIEMICSGEPVSAQKAAEIGLVFDAVPVESLIDEGKRLIEYAHETGEWITNREKFEQPMGLSKDQSFFSFGVADGYIRGKTKGQYPAPLKAIEAMQEGLNLPLQDGLQVELKKSEDVGGSEISGNMINVFFANNTVSKDKGIDDSSVVPKNVNRVGVLGGGLMGAGIATAHARSGIPTSLVDINEEQIAAGMKRATDVVGKRIKIGRAKHEDMQSLLTMLSASTSHSSFNQCDVVVEAVPESEELKTKVYKQLEPYLKEGAILASNTSTISITRMAESVPHPERFAGMHFFLPVDRMKLVEVIRGDKTDDETTATLVALSKRIRKTPIVCKDCPGFLVNRILFPYMNEAILMLLEGASMDAIDKAATSFGMPMGPIALSDMVGLDTMLGAGKVVSTAYSDRTVKFDIIDHLVAAGRLGKKSGSGFRTFEGKKGRPVNDPTFDPFLEKSRIDEKEFSNQEITNRLFLSMLLEAVRVLDESIVREPAHVDMGLLLGIGFPPFKGGLLKWCDNQGAGKIVDKADKLIDLGKRYEVPESLRDMAKSGAKYYPVPQDVLDRLQQS